MKSCPTYTATICVGVRASYSPTVYGIEMVRDICQKYCDAVGLGVTVTPTEFFYTEGSEPGALIGLINYPRFPSSRDEIRAHAFAIGARLLVKLGQERLSIVFSDDTIMLESNAE